MSETIKEIIIAFIAAGVLAILAYILQTQKNSILKIITELVNKAEATVQGSGMGEAKKKIVIAQLEAMGIKVTATTSKYIDEIVAKLNEASAWLVEVAKDDLPVIAKTASDTKE